MLRVNNSFELKCTAGLEKKISAILLDLQNRLVDRLFPFRYDNVVYLIIGQVKRAPHWGVQLRFRVVYMCRSVSQYVCHVQKCVGGITLPNMRMLEVRFGWFKPAYDIRVIHFDYMLELL